MMKVLGLALAGVLAATLVAQINTVQAKSNGKGNPNLRPISSPIPTPGCKPGWGFGDKNHCHFGPPGLVK